MEARGHRFFEDTLRIGRVVDLLNRARVQKEFEDKVVADAPRADRAPRHRADRLAGRPGFPAVAGGHAASWPSVSGSTRPRVLGAPEVGSFHNDRARLIDSVGREAQRVVDTYDKRREAEIDRRSGARRGRRGRGGRRRGGRPRHARDHRRVDGRRRRHRHPARERGARRRLPDHPGAAPPREGDARRRRWPRCARGWRRRCGPSSSARSEQSAHRLADAVAPYARFVRAEERRWSEAQVALSALRERISGLLAELSRQSAH